MIFEKGHNKLSTGECVTKSLIYSIDKRIKIIVYNIFLLNKNNTLKKYIIHIHIYMKYILLCLEFTLNRVTLITLSQGINIYKP